MAYHIWLVRSFVTTIGFLHKFSKDLQSIMVLLFLNNWVSSRQQPVFRGEHSLSVLEANDISMCKRW